MTYPYAIKMPQIVRFFEKSVEWLGLSKNSGSVLAVLYAEKYHTGRKLSLEELAEATSYSRSNVTLILSQLEALGIVQGSMDVEQTGRGRRRILYELHEGVKSPMALMVNKLRDRLQDSLTEIESLLAANQDDTPHIESMLTSFKREIMQILNSSEETALHLIE